MSQYSCMICVFHSWFVFIVIEKPYRLQAVSRPGNTGGLCCLSFRAVGDGHTWMFDDVWALEPGPLLSTLLKSTCVEGRWFRLGKLKKGTLGPYSCCILRRS